MGVPQKHYERCDPINLSSFWPVINDKPVLPYSEFLRTIPASGPGQCICALCMCQMCC